MKGGYQTKPSNRANWLSEDLEQGLVAQLKQRIPMLEGLGHLCPKVIDRWNAPPWKGFQNPHRDDSLGQRYAAECMVVMIPLTLYPSSKFVQVCPGLQGTYHSSNRRYIVVLLFRSVALLRGLVIHREAGGHGKMLFIPFVLPGLRSRMLTVELEALTD